MKIRLLENVSSHGLNGCKGQELELDDAVAIDLEKHGHAEFIGDDADALGEAVRSKAGYGLNESAQGPDEATTTTKKKKR
jgi:hypothetical protein